MFYVGPPATSEFTQGMGVSVQPENNEVDGDVQHHSLSQKCHNKDRET